MRVMEGTDKKYVVSFLDDENVLKLVMVMVAQCCEYTKTSQLYHCTSNG